MAIIVSLFGDKLASLEGKVKHQQEVLMKVEYLQDLDRGKAQRMPYISGRFTYGIGRPAVKREVLLFAKRAQTGREREEWPIMYLGKHTTSVAGALGSLLHL